MVKRAPVVEDDGSSGYRYGCWWREFEVARVRDVMHRAIGVRFDGKYAVFVRT